MASSSAFRVAALCFLFAKPVFAQELAYTVKPELQNRTEIKALVDSVTSLRFADGKETRTHIWAKIRPDGQTSDVSVRHPSGDTARDNFAVRVVQTMRWSPAEDARGIKETWIEIPVVIKSNKPQRR